MCEYLPCKNKSRFWVRRDSCNSLVCGKHLASTISRFWEMMPFPESHPSYKIQHGSSVVIQMKSESGGWR